MDRGSFEFDFSLVFEFEDVVNVKQQVTSSVFATQQKSYYCRYWHS
jgi:hypothetical protein